MTLRAMDVDVSAVEHKLEQLIALHRKLRDDNRVLREQVARLEGEKRALTDKIDTACTRLEGVMKRLPAA